MHITAAVAAVTTGHQLCTLAVWQRVLQIRRLPCNGDVSGRTYAASTMALRSAAHEDPLLQLPGLEFEDAAAIAALPSPLICRTVPQLEVQAVLVG